MKKEKIYFLICLLLLSVASAGFAMTSFQYISKKYKAELELYDIGVSLVENDKVIAWKNYRGDGLWDEEKGILLSGIEEPFRTDQTYACRLSVQNSGKIGEYVRVTLYQYWADKNGKKVSEVSPDNIHIHYTLGKDWVFDKKSQTEERTVLYYKKPLKPKEFSSEFTDGIHINGFQVKPEKKTLKKDGKTYTQIITPGVTHDLRFVLEAKVDAVQEHNIEDAAVSSWGQHVLE